MGSKTLMKPPTWGLAFAVGVVIAAAVGGVLHARSVLVPEPVLALRGYVNAVDATVDFEWTAEHHRARDVYVWAPELDGVVGTRSDISEPAVSVSSVGLSRVCIVVWTKREGRLSDGVRACVDVPPEP